MPIDNVQIYWIGESQFGENGCPDIVVRKLSCSEFCNVKRFLELILFEFSESWAHIYNRVRGARVYKDP